MNVSIRLNDKHFEKLRLQNDVVFFVVVPSLSLSHLNYGREGGFRRVLIYMYLKSGAASPSLCHTQPNVWCRIRYKSQTMPLNTMLYVGHYCILQLKQTFA